MDSSEKIDFGNITGLSKMSYYPDNYTSHQLRVRGRNNLEFCTMFFDFIMADVDDEDTRAALKPDLASFLEEQTEAYSEIVKSIEEETGIDGVKMIVIFMDANEEEIVSAHYDDEGKTL